MTLNRYIGSVLWMVLLACNAWAQAPSFKTVVERTTMTEGEALQVAFVIENLDEKSFIPPDFKDFAVLTGPLKSRRGLNYNGVTSWETSYVYLLQPKTTGKLTIGAATIDRGGKLVKTKPVTITVTKAGGKGGKKTMQESLAENVFFRLYLDKSEVYLGEQVTATYKLYKKTVQISRPEIKIPATYKSFWATDITPEQFWRVETLNNVDYNVEIGRQIALFPQQPGDLDVDPIGLECEVYVPTGMMSEVIPYKFSSNTAKVKVKPLPEAGKPSDFSGFVGELNMQVSLDKTKARTDDPITLSIKFSGKGNLKFFENPRPTFSDEFEVFDPKISEEPTKQGTTIGSTRQIDYLLIPRKAGTYKLPAITTSYFDLKKKEYVTLSSPEIVLVVEGESTITQSGPATGINKDEVELLGQDIRYINTTDKALKAEGGFFLSVPVFVTLYGLPFLLFGGLLVAKKRRDAMLSNTTLMKHRTAGKVAAKRLKQAEAQLKQKNSRGFYDELLKATWGYLGDKLGIPPADMGKEVAANTLRQKGVGEPLIKDLTALLDSTEMALYAPSSVSESLQQTYDRATAIIDQLENALV